MEALSSITDQLKRKKLSSIVAPVAEDVERLEPKLLNLLPLDTEVSVAIANHLFAAGGKRVRPALFYLCSKLVGYEGPCRDKMAAVCEYVHVASLLHDDVIDNSSVRRGKPTANAVWSNLESVLVGDLIYATASEYMAETRSFEIVSTFANAIRKMSEGELLQVEHAFSYDLKLSDYLKILECKTAVLLGTICKAPAYLTGQPSDVIQNLYQFGLNAGMAFQLVDDAMDYKGQTLKLGKASLSDLKDGKVTLPVILLRERATPEEWQVVKGIIKKKSIEQDDLSNVVRLIEKYDTVSETLKLAQSYTTKGNEALEIFDSSPERESLIQAANILLKRNF